MKKVIVIMLAVLLITCQKEEDMQPTTGSTSTTTSTSSTSATTGTLSYTAKSGCHDITSSILYVDIVLSGMISKSTSIKSGSTYLYNKINPGIIYYSVSADNYGGNDCGYTQTGQVEIIAGSTTYINVQL